jgi:hypothetical protein
MNHKGALAQLWRMPPIMPPIALDPAGSYVLAK